MRPILTSFTRLLGIKVPVVCAPMANVSSASLAAHVTLGGGFGFIAAGYESAQVLRKDLATVRSILNSGGSPEKAQLPIGVGYLAWKLDEAGRAAHDMLDAALENNVQAIWLAFGNNMGQWVNYIREKNQRDGQKTLVFVQVNSLAEALVAVNEWKTDVLIAQGIESGGHGGGYAPSVFSLVSSILAALPKNSPPLLAAGGLATGAQVASFLTLGAAGAALGTRFLLTPDSLYSVPQKAALLAADSSSTVRSLAFDRARNTLGWPQGIDGRGLRNEIVQDVEDGTDISIVRKKFAEKAQSGEPSYTIVWAGTGVGEMHEIKGAQQIVQEFHQEILERVQASQGLVGDSETQI